MGRLKRRIGPSDITINIGEGAPVPVCPITGERYPKIEVLNAKLYL
jgi:DNA topoisomerase-1